MKIVYLITRGDDIGGAQIHVRDLATAMARKGHDVSVICGHPGELVRQLKENVIPFYIMQNLIRPIQPLKDLRCIFELRSRILALKPDFISAHSSKAGWLGRIVGRIAGVPTIFTAHGWAFSEGVPPVKRKFYALAERLIAPFASHIITVSEHGKVLALQNNIGKDGNLSSVHNGMPDIDWSLLAKPDSGQPHMLMVARFSQPKEHGLLLRALAGLVDLDWRLELIGEGSLRKEMEQLAKHLGISERVIFSGACYDIADRLSKSHLFVLTSLWEGLPRTILEAMRAGLPVIASDVGGVHEAVIDNLTGFLVPPGDITSLRDRLSRLLTSPDLRSRMGQAGRQRYEELFTFERMIKETTIIYEALVKKHNASCS